MAELFDASISSPPSRPLGPALRLCTASVDGSSKGPTLGDAAAPIGLTDHHGLTLLAEVNETARLVCESASDGNF